MIRIVFILAALIAMVVFLKNYQSGSQQKRKKMQMWLAFGLLFSFVIFMTITGRLHYIAAIVTGLLPFVKKMVPLLQYVPLLRRFVKSKQNQGEKTYAGSVTTKTQAYEILGLKEGATKDEIIEAHRKLMQKCHPDRGGNDFLAAQLNQAKDLLLS